MELVSQANPQAAFAKRQGWPGAYDRLATSLHSQSPRIVFEYSATERPTEIYVADSLETICTSAAHHVVQ